MKKVFLTAFVFNINEVITIDDVRIEMRIDFPHGSYENNIHTDAMVNPDFVRKVLESALTGYINRNNHDYIDKEK